MYQRLLLVVGLIVAAVGDASAQAWVADKGALDVGLDYNLAVSNGVVVNGPDYENGGTTAHQFLLHAEYTPIPKLAVNVSLPFVMLKYTGDQVIYPHPGGGTYDDGELHNTLTDLRVGARYQVLEEPFALSPSLAVVIPVADYETVGNTVGGRGLKSLRLGLAAGYMIGPFAYVHLAYEFGLTEKFDRTADTAKHGQNTSDLTALAGVRLLQNKLDVHAGGIVHLTHGGVGIGMAEFGMLSPDEALYHDAIMKESAVLAGLGVGYQLTRSLAANVDYRRFLTGVNTQNASVLAIGLLWSR